MSRTTDHVWDDNGVCQIHGGYCSMAATDDLVQHADNAYEAIRALNHRTRQAIPAPVAYHLLGVLNNLGHGLDQLLGQIGDGLSRSLTEYDVYDHNRDPAESVAIATEAIDRAARHAHEVGELLAAAQVAINLQGYHVNYDDVDDVDDLDDVDQETEA
jgi:hypothetical protein